MKTKDSENIKSVFISTPVPEFSVPLVDAICKAHQNVCWYLKN